MNEPFDTRIQRKAEEHLRACQEALYEADEALNEGDDLPVSPASAPFCGCDTCVVREVLSVTWDELLREAQSVARHEPAVHIRPDNQQEIAR